MLDNFRWKGDETEMTFLETARELMRLWEAAAIDVKVFTGLLGACLLGGTVYAFATCRPERRRASEMVSLTWLITRSGKAIQK